MKRGFTLLEVVVAIAILAVSLLAIVNINAQAVAAHIYAKKLTIATLLARSKMIDLEQDLYDKPLPADDEEQSGDFSDDGWSQYKWRSKVVVPKTNGLTPEQLFGALFNMPMGDGKDGAGGLMGALFGASGGKPPGAPAAGADPKDPNAPGGILAALGPMAGLANAQFTQMVDQLQKSVREVHLTVTWKEGKLTESIDLVTHVVSMGPGSDRNGGAMAAAGAATGPAGEQWVRADNGMPVPNPKPSATGVGMVDPVDNSPLVSAAQWAAQRGGAQQPFGLPGNMPRPMVPQGVGTVITGGQKAIIQPRGGIFQ